MPVRTHRCVTSFPASAACCRKPDQRPITPHATRPPELPVGSVLRSSGPACTITARPMTPSLPVLTEIPSSQSVSVALPDASAVRLPRSPEWLLAESGAPCFLTYGLKWQPAHIASVSYTNL